MNRKRLSFIVCLIALLLLTGFLSYTYNPIALGWSNVVEYPNSTTYISAQGFHFEGNADETKPGRLVSVTPQGNTKWVWDGYDGEPNWFYDVEPVNESHLFVTLSQKNHTEGILFNKSAREIEWSEEFKEQDTHDMDLVGSKIYVAPMKKDYYEGGQKKFDDRAYIYNRTTGEVTWEWKFKNHYPTPNGNPRTGWTHLNDIDRINDTAVMLSPRNLDQVIIVNTTTGNIVHRLGENGNLSRLNRQHNPDLVSKDPLTILVADSENDRVIEYKYENGTWKRTWVLKGSLNWPRDADRLPSGNTLITDTLNHRVIEVTPQGRVVWEYFAPWAPYDADRQFDGSNGPSTASMNLNKTSYTLKGGSIGSASTETVGESHVCGVARDVPNPAAFSTFIETKTSGTEFEQAGEKVADVYSHHIQWIKPRWMSPWSVPTFLLALLTAISWVSWELLRYFRD